MQFICFHWTRNVCISIGFVRYTLHATKSGSIDLLTYCSQNIIRLENKWANSTELNDPSLLSICLHPVWCSRFFLEQFSVLEWRCSNIPIWCISLNAHSNTDGSNHNKYFGNVCKQNSLFEYEWMQCKRKSEREPKFAENTIALLNINQSELINEKRRRSVSTGYKCDQLMWMCTISQIKSTIWSVQECVYSHWNWPNALPSALSD